MKHNNQLPNVHLRKHWQTRVKTWFDQAGRKKRRRLARATKAAAVAPRPIDSLRSAVRCPTVRYNIKLREGRGFTLEELKAAKLSPAYARTIGISVDHRRRNRSQESLDRNVARLKAFLSKLVVLDKKNTMEMETVKSLALAFPILQEDQIDSPRAISPEEASFEAFKTLHYSRLDARYSSIRAKRAKAKLEEEITKKK